MASGGEIDLRESGERLYSDGDSGDRTGTGAADGTGDAGYVPGSDQVTPGMTESTNLSLSTMRTPGSDRQILRRGPVDFEFVRATNGNAFLTLTTPGLRAPALPRRSSTRTMNSASSPARPRGRRVIAWSESLVKVMTQGVTGMVIRAVLIVLFLLCMFIELLDARAGVFGIIARGTSRASWFPDDDQRSGLVARRRGRGGVLLIFVEVLIMPGPPSPASPGWSACSAGSWARSPRGRTLPGQNPAPARLAWAASIVLLSVFSAGVACTSSADTKYIPIANLLILQDPPRPQESMLSAMGASVDPEAPASVGDEGVATTRLMPSGQAEINGQFVDVVAGRAIDQGQRVRVISATRYRVAVELIPDDQPTPDGTEASS